MLEDFGSGKLESTTQTTRPSGDVLHYRYGQSPAIASEDAIVSTVNTHVSGQTPRAIARNDPEQDRKKSVDRNVARPETRDAIRRFWEAAKKKTEAMVAAARTGDDIQLGDATIELLHFLDDLWGLRKTRETDWGGILNFLQGAIRGLDYETFSVDQCSAIGTIVSSYLGPATVDKNDVQATLRLLKDVGFDPWRPISSASDNLNEGA